MLNEALTSPNAPEISDSIWAEPESSPALFKVEISVSFVVTLVLKLALASPNAPEISDSIWAELDNNNPSILFFSIYEAVWAVST